MKLSFVQMLALVKDFWVNQYALKCYKAKKKSKFAIVCAGGAYGMVCTGIEGLPIVKELRLKGYAVFMLRYRTKPKAQYPNPQDDLARAVKYILDNSEKLNVEKEDYSIWGFSAGGHLTASFGTKNMGYLKYNLPKPRLLVLSYPVISMSDFAHLGSRENLIGKIPTEQMINFTSIEKNIDADYPPCYLWCAENDDLVSDMNTKLLDAQLAEHKIIHKTNIVKDIEKGHGIALGKGTNAYGWLDDAVDFWENISKGKV